MNTKVQLLTLYSTLSATMHSVTDGQTDRQSSTRAEHTACSVIG